MFEWPAVSPDLNPIDNLWVKLLNRIYVEGRKYEDLSELKVAIEEKWDRMEKK